MREPRTDIALEIDESIRRLPAGAAVKGVFFTDVIRRASTAIDERALLAAANIAPKRWLPFFDYPYADWMRIARVAAAALVPNDTEAAGMRELGRHAYDAILETHVGRVVFGALGLDIASVLRHGPRGYSMLVNFGSIIAEPVSTAPKENPCVRYRLRDFPCFLETYQVGVFEGALRHCKVRGRVLIDLRDLANADFEISYEASVRDHPVI